MYTLSASNDLIPLMDDIDSRPVVLLGEASHGTHEYYTWRTAISKRLIQEKGFRFIAVEVMENYVPSILSRRYDAFIYLDETSALHPLHPEPHNSKTPETYPFGL